MDKTAIETGDSVMKDEGEIAIPVEMGSVNDSLPEGDAGVSSSATASTEKLPVDDAKQLSTDKDTDAPVASVKEASNNEDTNDRAGKSSEILDFTNRKVVIHNILKFEQVKDVKKMINKWFRELEDPESIKVTRIKKPPVGNFAQLTLETEAMVEPFMNLINNGRMTNKKGKLLFAKREDSKSDRNDATNEQGSKRDRNDEDDNGDSRKRRKKESSLPKTSDEIRDAITPLWKMPYEQQLQMKWREMVKKCTIKICQEIKAKFRQLERESKRNKNRKPVKLYDWLKSKRPIACEKIMASPQQLEYRNKCEFTFGYYHEVDSSAEAKEVKEELTSDGPESKAEKKNNEDEKDSEVNIIKTPGVGFCASGWSGGISRPHCCQNIPSESCGLVDIVNEFLRTSPIPPYDSSVHRGIWRTLTMRSSRRTGECMLVIMHAPPKGGAGAFSDGSGDFTSSFESEKARLVSMLTAGDLPCPSRDYPPIVMKKVEEEQENAEDASSSVEVKLLPKIEFPAVPEHAKESMSVKVTSIYFQEFDGLSTPKPEHPVQHAYGKLALEEKLGRCNFQISPGAFFQVNTEGAEILYDFVVQQVKEVTSDPQQTLLLDVCCGTGTIGLTCMKEGVVGRVLGVDISEPAIDDAKLNAEKNGWPSEDGGGDSALVTTRFVASRAEQVLATEMNEIRKGSFPIVAVVDPAREGLHGDVLRTLRINEKIQRLVYVSCNPTGTLVRDAAILCAPPTKKYPSLPFKPTFARPVDMFPLTNHCEMVMTFDRMQADEA